MTEDTILYAKLIESEIKDASDQILCIHKLDEESSYYEGVENNIPVGGIRIDVPGTGAIVKVPRELKKPLINMLVGFYQELIDLRKKELEDL